jgi:hypothetical protein
VEATSGSRRIGRGDAEAIFQAFGTGGLAILQHNRLAEGAPADDFGTRGSIRPFAGSPWDGTHLCAEDWHVILVADIEGGDSTFTRPDAEQIMQGLVLSFTLNGAPLPTNRTAIRRFLNPGFFGIQEAYYFQQGRIMSPTDLAAGSHQLQLTITDASGQTFQDGITFFIDPTGTGACV